MAADTVIVEALFDSYTYHQLRAARDAAMAAWQNPESLTSDQLDGVSFGFQPKTQADLRAIIENLNAAIARHAAGSTEEIPLETRSRYFNLSTRPIE